MQVSQYPSFAYTFRLRSISRSVPSSLEGSLTLNRVLVPIRATSYFFYNPSVQRLLPIHVYIKCIILQRSLLPFSMATNPSIFHVGSRVHEYGIEATNSSEAEALGIVLQSRRSKLEAQGAGLGQWKRSCSSRASFYRSVPRR